MSPAVINNIRGDGDFIDNFQKLDTNSSIFQSAWDIDLSDDLALSSSSSNSSSESDSDDDSQLNSD